MADGTVLRANVYYPTDRHTGKAAKGPFPVIMVQTPYGKDYAGLASGGEGGPEAGTEIGPLPYFIKRGYIDVVADVRGTGASHGSFGLLDPIQGRDGAELVDWASKLPHSNGRVGTYGPSYMGYTQLMTAHNVGRHSPLRAMFPIVVGNDSYRDVAFQGGLQGFEFDAVILALFGGLNVANPIGNINDLADLIQTEAEHVAGLLSYNAYQAANIETEGDQAFDGRYWQAREPRRWLHKIVHNRIPAFMVGGWYDLFQRGSPLDYSGLQNAFRHRPVSAPMKPGQKPTARYQLLMGPWYHVTAGAGFSIYPLELRWFDHWLKGKNTGIDKVRTPLHMYENGSGRWVDAKRYPLHSARRTPAIPAGDDLLPERRPEPLERRLGQRRDAADEQALGFEGLGLDRLHRHGQPLRTAVRPVERRRRRARAALRQPAREPVRGRRPLDSVRAGRADLHDARR